MSRTQEVPDPGIPPDSGKALKIVALGDSTTAGTPGFLSPLEAPPDGAGDVESQYAHWVMRKHRNWKVLNRGVNGERSDQVRGRFVRDVIKEQPDMVVILAGVNDIYQGFSFDFTSRNLSEMYASALRDGITPVSCSVLPYNSMGARAAEARRKLNGWISAESGRLGIPFSDTASSVSNPRNPDILRGSPDGLHPDIAGYRSMAQAISNAIEGHLANLHDLKG